MGDELIDLDLVGAPVVCASECWIYVMGIDSFCTRILQSTSIYSPADRHSRDFLSLL